DGKRFLVDRLWPRGIKKENLKLEGWLKEAAPSSRLRQWFGHDPERWEEFRQRYFDELKKHSDAWQPFLDTVKKSPVTLVYAAKDSQHNNAQALREFLEKNL